MGSWAERMVNQPSADGPVDGALARELRISANTVRKGRVRFAKTGLDDLADAKRSGRPKAYGSEVRVAIMAAATAAPPPPGVDLVAPHHG
ncbi:hypothetical protein [Streptomyces incanus]|uniref:Transposase n=1 Tax=Streptomyces incanus TaxID=887453 RepID=A0ABW0XFU5_9ACTN